MRCRLKVSSIIRISVNYGPSITRIAQTIDAEASSGRKRITLVRRNLSDTCHVQFLNIRHSRRNLANLDPGRSAFGGENNTINIYICENKMNTTPCVIETRDCIAFVVAFLLPRYLIVAHTMYMGGGEGKQRKEMYDRSIQR